MRKQFKNMKVQILKEKNVAEKGNTPVIQCVPIHEGTLWAYYRSLTQKEIYTAMQTKSEVEVIFIINWLPKIKTSMIVRYNGKDYNITRIDDFDGRKKDLKLYAKRL